MMGLFDALTLESVLVVVLGLLLLPMVYAMRRGPSTADRVLALEVIGAIATLMLLALSVVAQRPIYLDLAVLVTLFSFLGTLVMARYMERGLLR